MKKIITLSIFVLAFAISKAQVCDYWYPLKQGNHFSWNNFNSKGKLTGTNEYTVTASSNEGTASVFTVHSVVKDDKGKEQVSSDMQMKCADNSLLIDMKNFIPQQSMDAYKDMQLSFTGNTLSFPSSLTVGAKLPDGTITMTVNSSSMEIATIVVNIKDRKIEGEESITTTAGTFNCYKISSTTESVTTTMGIKIPFTMKSIEYYSAGNGLIKSESFSKDSKPMGYMELASVNK